MKCICYYDFGYEQQCTSHSIAWQCKDSSRSCRYRIEEDYGPYRRCRQQAWQIYQYSPITLSGFIRFVTTVLRLINFIIAKLILSVMHQSFMKNGNASIINLFEKMDSNITKFRASLTSSPTPRAYSEDQSCPCVKNQKERRIERDFYLGQEDLVRHASMMLKSQGNETLAKLLNFMSEYLARIGVQLGKELVCECKMLKISDYNNLTHKISFLRDENHKFFKMIEEKTEECDELKSKLEQIQTLMGEKPSQGTPTVHHQSRQSHFSSLLSDKITSRIISSNSSRVSQFRQAWPELTLPMGEVGHKRYFQAPPGDRCGMLASSQVLQQKSMNYPSFESTFRKAKIFDHHH